MPTWLLAIIVWWLAGCIISYITRRSLAKYYIEILQIRDEASDTEPYQRGFKDGVMGTKMYHTLLEKMPDSQWVLANCMKKLDTREKILETLTEGERNAIYKSFNP